MSECGGRGGKMQDTRGGKVLKLQKWGKKGKINLKSQNGDGEEQINLSKCEIREGENKDYEVELNNLK